MSATNNLDILMPSYKSNTASVVRDLVKKLKGVDGFVKDKVLREVAADVAASNVYRIHNEGKAVDGSGIGDYKEGPYKEKRQERGRRIDKVDLSMTGKLSKEYTFDAIGTNEVGVGFLTDYGTRVSEALEEKYKKKIWGATQEDERIAQEVAKNRINQYLNG